MEKGRGMPGQVLCTKVFQERVGLWFAHNLFCGRNGKHLKKSTYLFSQIEAQGEGVANVSFPSNSVVETFSY